MSNAPALPTSAAAKAASERNTLPRLSELSDEVCRPFPRSRKVYVEGSRPDLRVPMREVELSDSPTSHGGTPNAPFALYDTSGPYTDPDASIDLRRGLPSVRGAWIAERGDTEQLGGLTSEFGRDRAADAKLDHLRFE